METRNPIDLLIAEAGSVEAAVSLIRARNLDSIRAYFTEILSGAVTLE